jgi:hypothetical protein
MTQCHLAYFDLGLGSRLRLAAGAARWLVMAQMAWWPVVGPSDGLDLGGGAGLLGARDAVEEAIALARQEREAIGRKAARAASRTP